MIIAKKVFMRTLITVIEMLKYLTQQGVAISFFNFFRNLLILAFCTLKYAFTPIVAYSADIKCYLVNLTCAIREISARLSISCSIILQNAGH